MVAQLVFIAERCSPYSTIDFYWVLSCQLILNRDIKIDHFQSCSNIIQMGLFSDNFQTLCVGLIKYHHILVDFFLSLSKSCATAKGMCKTKKKVDVGRCMGWRYFSLLWLRTCCKVFSAASERFSLTSATRRAPLLHGFQGQTSPATTILIISLQHTIFDRG